MATFQEHAIADFTRALEESGVTVSIDAVAVDVFVSPVEDINAVDDGMIVSRKLIFHLPGALPAKVPGQAVTIDGLTWTVMSHQETRICVCLKVERVLA